MHSKSCSDFYSNSYFSILNYLKVLTSSSMQKSSFKPQTMCHSSGILSCDSVRGGGCRWHQEGRGQECCSVPQRIPHTKSYLALNATSAKVKTPSSTGRRENSTKFNGIILFQNRCLFHSMLSTCLSKLKYKTDFF